MMNKPTGFAALQGSPAFQWYLGDLDDARQAHAIHCEVLREIPPGTLRPVDLEFFRRHTGTEGLLTCCKNRQEDMVAYAVLGTASANTDRLATLLGIAERDRARFAILDGVACRPGWRGLQLHQAAIAERLAHARAMRRTLIGATVSPINIASLRGTLTAGFTITGAAFVYGGLERLLLKSDRDREAIFWTPVRSIEAGDFEAHQAAIAEGLQGYACNEARDGSWRVHYGLAED